MEPTSQIELLGLVAYGSLAAFERTAQASAAATSIDDKLVLARIAAQRFTHLGRLETELARRGSTLKAAMEAFVAPIDSFNQHTEPRTWGEVLVKLCIIGGLVQDFADEISGHLDAGLREILTGSIDDGELASEPGQMLARALQEDPEQQGRLALFGRRMLGEALSQAQRVAAARADLTGLLTGLGQDGGDDLAAISHLMSRLAAAHATRMESLGLA
ncbi:tRNA-(MS[2]IO[6]A)-hydroxylase MiaE-like protein [Luteococcus japonicus]|uniref:tRNA-(MS[2]IO[6]A)-hydroxylase MiaE-like protein n=1 Tax=Luteococcus japonicus TaxID=33984 RepID=A0A3N1ZRF9_9ACTN|nr:tRNA-(MS[2]IO[6]A)-hydroxylase MiaE-like protein [Luteococcus japonicus]ROR56029.1 tRNA-(MS[2]IO[6]A)-hydroxylase MiaE-like protein [Luteococcus japonicus]